MSKLQKLYAFLEQLMSSDNSFVLDGTVAQQDSQAMRQFEQLMSIGETIMETKGEYIRVTSTRRSCVQI